MPLENAEEVFRSAGSVLGSHLRRVPDGETGDRLGWVLWQLAVMAETPGLEARAMPVGSYGPPMRFCISEGAANGELIFGPLGYSDAALDSYKVFSALRTEGVIAEDCRFQVSLPTPLAPISTFVASEDQERVEVAYERRLLAEVDEIVDAIPHDDLAIQWDTAVEFGMLEGNLPRFEEPEGEIMERLARLGNHVPEGVELGFHLCYGDYGHKHFMEPKDTGKLTRIANLIAERVSRPLNWMHMPVPRDRDDDAYFAPLSDLALHPETELYLGLVHHTDGAEGTRRRIATAQRVTPEFGVATECGFGRRPSETVADLLHTMAEVAEPIR